MAPRLLGLWERAGSAGRPVSGNGVAHEQLARTGRAFSAGNAGCYMYTHANVAGLTNYQRNMAYLVALLTC